MSLQILHNAILAKCVCVCVRLSVCVCVIYKLISQTTFNVAIGRKFEYEWQFILLVLGTIEQNNQIISKIVPDTLAHTHRTYFHQTTSTRTRTLCVSD